MVQIFYFCRAPSTFEIYFRLRLNSEFTRNMSQEKDVLSERKPIIIRLNAMHHKTYKENKSVGKLVTLQQLYWILNIPTIALKWCTSLLINHMNFWTVYNVAYGVLRKAGTCTNAMKSSHAPLKWHIVPWKKLVGRRKQWAQNLRSFGTLKERLKFWKACLHWNSTCWSNSNLPLNPNGSWTSAVIRNEVCRPFWSSGWAYPLVAASSHSNTLLMSYIEHPSLSFCGLNDGRRQELL